MSPILDCLVSYFGLDEDEQIDLRRYYCYHVVGGPGPTAASGVATVTTLAVYDESQRCNFCQNFYSVVTDGPAAAIAKAVSYLDNIHLAKHVRKVQSDLRGL
jgi:hypothetical protein